MCLSGALPNGRACQSPTFWICLPAVPGEVFGVEVACHNGGNVRIWREDAVYFDFGQNRLRAVVTSFHLEEAFGMFDIDADSRPLNRFGRLRKLGRRFSLQEKERFWHQHRVEEVLHYKKVGSETTGVQIQDSSSFSP